MTNDADHDPEFEAFLRRRSPLHRRLSQIDHAEPSGELDRIVLDRARDAIGAPSQEPLYRKSRWAMPLGLAAAILIAFTVVLNIDHRRAESLGENARNVSARLADMPAPTPARQLFERAEPEAAAGADDSGAGASQATEARSPAPASARDTSAAERRQLEEQKLVAKSEVSPAMPAAAAPPPEQPALTARASAENPADAERDDPSFSDEATGNAGDIVARRDRTLASGRSGIARLPAEGTASAGHTPPPPASAPVADVHASPEAWLREIDRLRAAGKTEEADRELAAFRKAHPAHPGYSLAQPPTR